MLPPIWALVLEDSMGSVRVRIWTSLVNVQVPVKK
jgi:hypothetical protein